ncbi:Separin [Spathaspora sp. JA1]|nr:Separin [Spathaspora sp. JA1]
MKDIGIDQGVLSFIQSQSTTPLSPSKTANIPQQHDLKRLESICLTYLGGNLVTNGSTESITPTFIKSVSSGLSCLYLIYSNNKQSKLGIFRKHQLFIVKLLESGQSLLDVFEELAHLYEQIHTVLSLKNYGKITINSMIKRGGIPFVNIQEDSIIQTINSFHFFLLQGLLQYLSKNLRSILTKSNKVVNLETIEHIPNLFLNISNIRRWQSSRGDSSKHNKNLIKLLSGYIKVFSSIKSTKFKNLKGCLQLKLVELTQDTDLLNQIEISTELIPFINDSKDVPQLEILLSKIPHIEHEASKIIHELQNCSSAISLNSLEANFLESPNLVNNTSVLQAMIKKFQSSDSMKQQLCQTFISFLVHGNIEQLLTLHLNILDSITIFIKDYVTEGKSFPEMQTILSQLFVVYSKYKQTKRVRNLSNLFYNIGNKSEDKNAWYLSVDYECYILDVEPSENNLVQLSTKFQRLATQNPNVLVPFLKSCSKYSSSSEKISFDNLTVHVISKILTADPSLVSHINQLENDNFKASLIEQLFNILEKFPNSAQKQQTCDSIIRNVSFKDQYFEHRVQFAYYNVAGLENYLHLSISGSDNPLILAGFQVLKLINGGWDEVILEECICNLETWLGVHDIANEFEIDIFTQIISYFKFNGLTGHLIKIIDTYKTNKSPLPELKILLESELSLALSKLSLHSQWSDSLMQLNQLLSEIKPTLNQVMNYNLHQLDYYIETGNLPQAKEKFNKILSTLQSRPEYKLDPNSSISMTTKFDNFIFLGKFQYLSSKLNRALHQSIDASHNAKNAIQILYSLIKKIGGSSISGRNMVEIKWELTHLLFDAYNIMVELLSELGISRDIPFYLKEYNKVNSSINKQIPIVNCFNDFVIGIFQILLNSNDKTNLESARAFFQLEIVEYSFTLQQYNCFVSSLMGDNEAQVHYPQYAKWQDIPFLHNCYRINKNQELKWKFYYSLHRDVPFHSIEGTCDDKEIQLIVETTESLSKVNKMLSDVKQLCKLPNTVQLFPSVISDGACNPIPEQIEILNLLVKCKDRLIGCLKQGHYHIPILEYRTLYHLLHRCMCMLSSMSTFTNGSDLLSEFLLIQDRMNSYMFHNERMKSILATDNLLPREMPDCDYPPHFDNSLIDFKNDLSDYMPSNMTIISIDICSVSGDLLLSKIVKGKDCIFLRLPVTRSRNQVAQPDRVVNFKEMKEKFNGIIDESDQSTKRAVTSQVNTKEERQKWWKLRFNLDYRLQSLLNDVQNYWIGGFAGIFSGFQMGIVFDKFKNDFLKILSNSLPSRKNGSLNCFQFDDTVIYCLYSLKEYSRELVDDILYYLIDTLSFHGEFNDYCLINFDKLHHSVEVLLDKYNPLRFATKQHLVIVPSSRCSFFPWESLPLLQHKLISRMPSISMIIDVLKSRKSLTINPYNDLFYVLNPGGDLGRSEERFKKYFTANQNWKGIIGKKPEEEEIIQGISQTKLFVYIGHGGCDQYFKISKFFKEFLAFSGSSLPPSLLLGCSSGALKDNGIFEPSGNIYTWLTCGVPMALVNLWDVTDKDIDTFSISMFESWGLFKSVKEKVDFTEAVSRSREKCTLSSMNGAAPVVYGLPLTLE